MHNFDKVYLITSFASNDTPERLGLCEILTRDISQYFPCKHIHVEKQDEWDKAWETIEKDCEDGINPMVHLAMHGEIEGIRVQCFDEPYRWSDLLDRFERVDNLCNHQLQVFMQVCHGAHCLADLLKRNEPPFATMIASPDEIDAGNTFEQLKYFYEKASASTFCDALYTFFEKNKLLESFYHNRKYRWCLLKKEEELPHKLFACLITSNMNDLENNL